ncbi:unnamed protein product [Parajaminaea phylloscopi]
MNLFARDAPCSGSTPVSQCSTGTYNLPSAGNTGADWAVGGIFVAFYLSTCWGTYRAFQRRKTLRLPWISLLSFTAFRAVGFLMKGWTDSNPIQDDWTYDRAASWVKILTASYSIISAGTTFFLIFCGSLVVAQRRCCAEACKQRHQWAQGRFGTQQEVEATADAREARLRKVEDAVFMAFRFFVIAVAAINIVGALRQFDYYWLNYEQGVALRKVGGYLQLATTVVLLGVVCASQLAYRAPVMTLRGYFLLTPVIALYLVEEVFSLVRVYRPLSDPVNADPTYLYCLQALPDFLNLFHLIVFNFDDMLDYEAIRQRMVSEKADSGKA